MNAERWELVKRVFAACLDAAPDEREALIRAGCPDDEEAECEVRRMLRHAAEDEAPPRDDDPLAGAAGPRRIGPYEVVALIGSGASAMVYRARDPRRGVEMAVKVLRLAVASERGRRRLEYEGEVLSGLDHPGIARVFEVGATETEFGTLPFIAMELVEGMPIDLYADERSLDDRARVALVARVCDAMAYAHRRGVIHRDLKPANILVDSQGRPRVLDFGIARSLLGELRATTISTHTGDVLGTPGYMSPEQCRGDAGAADTRSDVYALGVVLFELLTRQRLFDVGALPLLAALEVVGRAEPPLLGSIRPALRGPYEDVAARAMDRDPRRRYESAASLGDDLRRALRGETVHADPVSALVRARRVLRRHRPVLLASGAIVSLLLVAMLLVLRGYGASLAEARREAAVAEARAEVSNCTLRIIAAESLELARADLRRVYLVLDDAALTLEEERVVFDSLGNRFAQLGDPLVAAELYARGLTAGRLVDGADHEQSLRRLQVYTEALAMSGRPFEAELLIREELQRWGFSPATLSRRASPGQNQRLLRISMTLGEALGRQGREPEAVSLLEGVLEAQIALIAPEADGREHSDVRDTRAMLAHLRGVVSGRGETDG